MKRTVLMALAFAIAAFAIPAVVGAQTASTVQLTDPYTEVIPPGAEPGAADAATASPARTGDDGPALLRRAKGSGGKLLVGFGDPHFVRGEAVRVPILDEAVGLNAGVVRLEAFWRSIAPANLGSGFDPKDPASPQYSWTLLDAAVRDATARGLRPLLLINGAPDWAEGPNRPADALPGTWKPDPSAVADFGTAIARRYSGDFQDLPEVKDYIFWNEPNLPSNLTPQFDSKGKDLLAADHYTKMLNAFYDAVHGVDDSNRVVSAGNAPYGSPRGKFAVQIRPLQFWRSVLCVSSGKNPRALQCPEKPKFDVFAHHPINTSGGPTTSAISPDDVSTPDLGNLIDVLRVAERGGNVGTKGTHPVWATEIWWETDPPDNFKTNPSLATQAKWYAQSLYLLWKQGASMVLFYQVRDEESYGKPGRFPGSSYETGVYFADGKAKPSSRAVRFPFVAERSSESKVVLWGIAPKSGKLTVSASGKGSKKLTSLNVKAGRIFTKTVKLAGRAKLDASVGGETSLGYPVR